MCSPATLRPGSYNFWAEKELPGEDRLLVRYEVSVEGQDPEKFSKRIPVTLEVMTEDEESAAKDVEIARCREVIRKYIPTDKQDKFYELVARRQDTLGPKGLATLRKKIWGIAVQLILAEGAEGYKLEAEWANRIVVVFEWAEWAGDIAFNAAAGALCGPYGAAAAGLIKGFMISAIRCYESGQSIEDWANENIWSVIGMVEGQVMDVDLLEKLTGGSRTKDMGDLRRLLVRQEALPGDEPGGCRDGNRQGDQHAAVLFLAGPEGEGIVPEARARRGEAGAGGRCARWTETGRRGWRRARSQGTEEARGHGRLPPGRSAPAATRRSPSPPRTTATVAGRRASSKGKRKVDDFVEAMKSGDPEAKQAAGPGVPEGQERHDGTQPRSRYGPRAAPKSTRR